MLTKKQLIDIIFWKLNVYFSIDKKTIKFLERQKKEWIIKLDNMLIQNIKRRQK